MTIHKYFDKADHPTMHKDYCKFDQSIGRHHLPSKSLIDMSVWWGMA